MFYGFRYWLEACGTLFSARNYRFFLNLLSHDAAGQQKYATSTLHDTAVVTVNNCMLLACVYMSLHVVFTEC